MSIYDLEQFITEFGFIKTNEHIADTYKEYNKKDFFVIIRKLASLKSKIAYNKNSDNFKIQFGKKEIKNTTMRILPLKGSLNKSLIPSEIQSEVITTIKEVINYEEHLDDGIKDVINSIKEEMASDYRKFKINKILKDGFK